VPDVFHNDADIIEVGADWIARLKRAATSSPKHRARLCLHRSETDAIQEMIIVLSKSALFPPLRQYGRTKSYHMVEGELCILLFDEEGRRTGAVHLAAPGSTKPFCYRLSAPLWNATVPLSDMVVYHETQEGPYTPHLATVAPWAPGQPEALRAFLQQHLAQALAGDGAKT
jgi:cupin fold WbuC family metalloprotein